MGKSPKHSRYISKFKESVREQWKMNRNGSKTMGSALSLQPVPTNYLKKNSRYTPQVSYSKNCALKEKRPPIPKHSSTHEQQDATQKNFLKANINRVIKSAPPKLYPKFVDTNRGNVQHMAKSGLKPEYVFKKNFGHPPKFIEKRKEDNTKCEKQDNSCSENEYKMHTKLSDQERSDLVEGLKKRLEEKNTEFLLLPVIIDTPYLINYKRRIEKTIAQLEKDIENIESCTVIYVCN